MFTVVAYVVYVLLAAPWCATAPAVSLIDGGWLTDLVNTVLWVGRGVYKLLSSVGRALLKQGSPSLPISVDEVWCLDLLRDASFVDPMQTPLLSSQGQTRTWLFVNSCGDPEG